MSGKTLTWMIGLILPFVIGAGSIARAGTATDISGLYFTGLKAGGGLQSGGSQDGNWKVSYASTNGGTSPNSTFTGKAYVVNAAFVSSVAWVQNTSNAQWITAPGAQDNTNGNSVNTGGSYLPGNGSSGSNEGVYIYSLQFNVIGNGNAGDLITNNMAISLTIAADDQAKIYVNPSGNGGSIPTGTAAVTIGAGAWTNTASAILANYNYNGQSAYNNSTFKIGTNYLVVVVANTNGIGGSSSATGWNASGFMMYQVGSLAIIDGKPVPEMAPWMPIAGVLGLYGCIGIIRRRRQSAAPATV